jgi:glutamyl-tRNA reductase
MKIGVIGISYRNAPLDIRQRLTFTKSKKSAFAHALKSLGLDEVMVLATCNRSEIYYVYNGNGDVEAMIENYIAEKFGKDIRAFLYFKSETHAISHLYVVANGLDSMVVGEDQILGQVKSALDDSIEEKMSGKILNKIALGAITFAKKTKTKYRISENPLSLASIAVKYIHKKIGSYKGKDVMVIGMGKFGQLVLKYAYGTANIFVATRRHSNVSLTDALLCEYPDISIVPFDERYEAIKNMDVIFGATASPHLVVSADKVLKPLKKQVFMDIAVPRDIDPRVAKGKNIALFDVDDLKAIGEKNARFRQEVSVKIADEIRNEAEKMEDWIIKSTFDTTIKQLNDFGDSVYEDALDMAQKNIDLGEKDYENMQKILKSCVKRIINTPIKNMKSMDKSGGVQSVKDTVSYLFDLDEEQ